MISKQHYSSIIRQKHCLTASLNMQILASFLDKELFLDSSPSGKWPAVQLRELTPFNCELEWAKCMHQGLTRKQYNYIQYNGEREK